MEDNRSSSPDSALFTFPHSYNELMDRFRERDAVALMAEARAKTDELLGLTRTHIATLEFSLIQPGGSRPQFCQWHCPPPTRREDWRGRNLPWFGSLVCSQPGKQLFIAPDGNLFAHRLQPHRKEWQCAVDHAGWYSFPFNVFFPALAAMTVTKKKAVVVRQPAPPVEVAEAPLAFFCRTLSPLPA